MLGVDLATGGGAMSVDHHFYISDPRGGPRLTKHARKRMNARRLSSTAVQAALDWGREVHTRGATIYVVGRKQVQRCREQDIDISGFEGMHAVCSADGDVITVYRNQDLRGLRPRRRRRRRRN